MPSVTPRMFLAAALPSRTSTSGDVELDLPCEERRASLDLLRRRRAVAGRTPIDGVGDVDVVLAKSDRLEHAVEQLSRAADERPALQVLVAAGRFADQHEARAVAPAREAEALRRALERATFEARDQGFELGKSGRAVGCVPARVPAFGGGAVTRSGGRACACREAQRSLAPPAKRSGRPVPRRSPRRRPSPRTSPIRLEPPGVPLQSFLCLWRGLPPPYHHDIIVMDYWIPARRE